MKKYLAKILLVVLLTVFLLPNISFAQEALPVYLTLFYGDGCPHCAKEEAYLSKLEKEFPSLKVRKLEVWHNQDNVKIMEETGKKLNIQITGVPLTLIGNKVISGYLNDQTTGQQIKKIIQQHLITGCADIVGDIDGNISCEEKDASDIINLPLFGEVNFKSWSLPILTIVIGSIDGFNPCAMWVLLFLISLLLGMENRRKMWVLGFTFILTSALVYFFFLAAWLNLFLFLSYVTIIRSAIGVVAVVSGGYHLKEWWFNRNATCRATSQEKREKIMSRLRWVTEQKVFWLALIGIIVVAVAVNMVEVVCSAGLPAIYTQILAGANLSTPIYYLYLLLYILFYMIDDLIVFMIAMTTLQAFGISNKYTHWTNLFGGIIILILGLLLI